MIFAIDLALFALLILMLFLLARIAMSWIFTFAREWQPTGVSALLVETVYVVTDPLIKPLRRVLPPLTIGMIRLDVAFLLVFFAVIVMRAVLTQVRWDLAGP
ncbi:YggT family protein [Demequina sp.]|uniref:YggT family protein n=1 Tax=Demequina sp. TaxID=2050685 RepID=UPI0025C18B2E|nr:YggT family protein [Demequina sp.]